MANVSINSATGGNIGKTKKQTLEQSLAEILADLFRNEFKTVHLSGQLLKSIKVTADESGNYQVEIPPKIYDVAFYRRHKVVRHVSQDSYAYDVNFSGGFSGMHKDYVSRCLARAIQIWADRNKIQLKIDTSVVK